MVKSEAGQAGVTTPGRPQAMNIQTTAKWLVTAFAATGAVLLAGLNLTNLGRLTSDDRVALAVAVIAAVTALVLVYLVILSASKVLTPSSVTLTDLKDRWIEATKAAAAEARTDMSDDELSELARGSDPVLVTIDQISFSLFRGLDVRTPVELNAALNQAYRERSVLTQTATRATIPESAAALRETLDARITELRAAEQRLVDYVEYAEVARTYRDLVRKRLPWCGIGIAVGIVVFAIASNPPVQPDSPITSPTPVTVILHQARDLRPAGVPNACARRTFDATAIGGTLREPLVVARFRERACPMLRFVVTEEAGIAVPKSD
jgi:ElaB/YqjD/DUF883 family membrane-anchored ribosome-binding protein